MQKEYYKWNSEFLNKEIEISSYGHFGTTILLFSSNTPNHKEIEENGFLDLIYPMIHSGRCRIFSVTNLQDECWLDDTKRSLLKSKRHFEFNKFIEEELVPQIYTECGGPVPIITAGASYGGFIASNTFFRRPDLFIGTIALSATFNIEHYSKDYYDENCYFNSPVHYLPNLTDKYWVTHLLSRHHIYLASGSGENENPHNTSQFGDLLNSKGFRANVEIWGNEFGHNWESWSQMLKHFISHKL